MPRTVQRELPSPLTEKLRAAVDTGLTGALWDQELASVPMLQLLEAIPALTNRLLSKAKEKHFHL